MNGKARVRRSWPLSAYLAALVAVFVIVAAASAIFVSARGDSDARQAAESEASSAAAEAATFTASGIEAARSAVASLAANPQIAGILGTHSSCTLSFAGSGPFSTGHLDIVRSDGSVACSSRPQVAGTPYAGADWLRQGLTSAVLIGPTLDSTTGVQVAVAAAPITSAGVVAALLELSPVGPNLTKFFGGPHRLEFLVTTGDGKTALARSINPTKWVGAAIADTPFGRATNSAERPDLDGNARLYGESPVAGVDWRVYSGAYEVAILAVNNALTRSQLAILLIGVVAMLAGTFAVYRRITGPIRQLSEGVGRTTTEEGGDPVPTNGPTEVAALASNFNQMIATVKRELDERRRAESNYRLLFEGSSVAMFVYDIETSKALEVNEAALALYGYSRHEFEEVTITAIRSPADGPFSQDFSGPDDSHRSLPDRHRRKDGSIVEVSVAAHNVQYASRSARFVMVEDKTEKELLERQLQQEQARLEASAEVNRVKDELVSMVSHELRTPLASVVGFTELLQSREFPKAERKKYMDVMLREGRRLTSLINDFLDLQRMEGGVQLLNLGQANLGALVNRAVASAGEDTKTPIRVDLDDDLPLVIADPDRILQVLTNLLSNARKYSPGGGEIRVFAHVADQAVEVSVQDQGLGIPPEARAHLFERFYRIDTGDRREIRGTGLGLSITQKIIEAHGGKVGVDSAGPGKGSRFYFSLALAPSSTMSGDVLIVEDDAGFVQLLRAELATKGLSVIWAPDVETAEAVMERASPQAVVLDLLLPGLQGEDFLTRHRASNKALGTVVVVTVKDLSATELAALQALGVTAVLRKQAHVAKDAVEIVTKAIVAGRR